MDSTGRLLPERLEPPGLGSAAGGLADVERFKAPAIDLSQVPGIGVGVRA